MNKDKKVLTVFSLVMINIIAFDSLRTLPFSAKFGSTLIFYYSVCGLLFLLPITFISAELTTTWPKTGGIYVWVKEAFGDKSGFLVVWLQWSCNIVWFITILGLVAGIFAYLFKPELVNNKFYVFSVILIIFWFSTIINFWGMKLSSFVSTIGSIFGTLFSMLIIMVLGIFWFFMKKPVQIDFSISSIIPKIDSLNDLVLVTTVLFGLMGLEMSAVHASEVREPSKDYPKSLFISTIIILFFLVLSSLAIASVVGVPELSILVGLIQAFKVFFDAFGASWMLQIIVVLIIVGIICQVSTWSIGLAKGLFAAALDKNIPAFFGRTNKYNVPVVILSLQAIIVTVLSLLYTFFSSIEVAYLVFAELMVILALLKYVFMFLAAIILRYKRKDIRRPFKIPFGNIGIWFFGLCGALTCICAILLCFLPPSQIIITNVAVYQGTLIIGVIIFCLPAFFIRKRK